MPEEVVTQQTEVPGGKETPAGGTPESKTTVTPPAKQEPKPGEKSGESERERGILADLQKERKERQRLEALVAQTTGQLTAEQKRVRALAGLETQSPEEQEDAQIRARIVKMFPALGKLSEEQVDAWIAQQQELGGLQETTQHYWKAHGRQMLSQLHDAVADEVGSDLTERQQKALTQAYVLEAQNNPEFLARHNAGDKTLITEFSKQWVEDWFEPARRTVINNEITRQRRVPGDGRQRSVVTTPAPKIDVNDPKAVEDVLVEGFKSRGGAFGRK